MSASSLVAVETAAAPNDLWIPPALFLHDWAQPVVVHTSWTTDLAALAAAGEIRTGLAAKPSRRIDVAYRAMDQGQAALLRSCLRRWTMARTVVPLFCDQSVLLADAHDDYLVCDTTCRRFCAGERVAVWPATAACMASSFELAVIAGVAAGSLSLASVLVGDYAAGALVAPVLECDLVPELSCDYVTDMALEARLTFRESVGKMTLPPAAQRGSVPDGMSTYDGYPILALPANWGGQNSGGARRSHEATQVGLTSYIQTHGTRFAATQTLDYLALDRAGAWAAMQFFDSRGGRQEPFIAVDLTSEFAASTPPATGAGTVGLVAAGPLLDWNWRTHLVLTFPDDHVVVRKITGVARAGGVGRVDTVTLDAVLPSMTGWRSVGLGAGRISTGFLGRFDADDLQETWTTDQVMQAALPAVEVVREGSVTLAHLPAGPTGAGLRGSNPAGATELGAATLVFQMEDATAGGADFTGATNSSGGWDVAVTIHGGGQIFFHPYVERTGSRGNLGAWLFHMFARRPQTLTVDFTYLEGFGKKMFPLVNGARVNWKDGSSVTVDLQGFTSDSKQLDVAAGDLIEIGMEVSYDFGATFPTAFAQNAAEDVAYLTYDEPTATQNRTARITGAAMQRTFFSNFFYAGPFTCQIYADAGVPWEIAVPAGVTVTPSSGVGPATVAVDAITTGTLTLQAGTMTWTGTVFGATRSFTRPLCFEVGTP